jgi:PAS domain S-box-containing protein
MSQARPFPIVAIGASAGGFEALERFLSALPENFDLALVFIQRFSPKHRGLIPQLLLTSGKPGLVIEDASDGLEVCPGRLYLCPPAAAVTIGQGVFRVSPRDDDRRHHPVDEFLESLAADMGERSIAVILSGSGSDGARGVLAIRAAGGTVFVQDPATAENGEMPMAAIDTGQMDGVLPPGEIAAEIVKLHSLGMVTAFPDAAVEQGDLEVFLRILYEKTGYRFDHYKASVIGRRIRRRMYLHDTMSAHDYLEILATGEGEAGQLASDLMIGVTSFFRDRPAWDALREDVAARLVAREDDSPIRVWCAACATGEEAYSIAMLLHEEAGLSGARKEIQVFATDVNENALERAREGTYPAAVSADMPPGYMEKFFVEPRGNLVSISKEIREHVLFAKHDILSDPPFSRIDLVICRNLLIYLEQAAQEKCISLFHYGLKKGGHLFLGGAESPGGSTRLFVPLPHRKCRLYQRADSSVLTKTLLAPLPVSRPSTLRIRQAPAEGRRSTIQLVHEALLDEFTPPAVAVDGDYAILFHSGPTYRYLRDPGGATTGNLVGLLPETAAGRVKRAFGRAAAEKKVSVDVMMPTDDGKKKRVSIGISKLPGDIFLVVFREKVAASRKQAPGDVREEPAVDQLEHELSVTRGELRRHMEQIRNVNEELRSSNEEFQAANEELETSREELQSVNEELTSLNAQLQRKIAEEEQANNDLANFIASTAIPTVFLDESMRIKRFTPAMAKLVDMSQGDVGKPLSDLANGERLGSELLFDARAVLDDLVPKKRTFGAGSSWYIRTILPYRTSDNRIEGVVVTCTDITEIRAAEERSRHLASFPLLNPNPVMEVDIHGAVIFINPSARAILDASGFGHDDGKALLPGDLGALLANWDRTTESTVQRDVRVADRVLEITLQFLPHFQVVRVYGRDITKRKAAEESLRESEHRIRRKLESILSPQGDLGDLALIDIMDADAIGALMSNFHGLFPVAMAVADLKGKILVRVGWQEICTRFHRGHPDTCKSCLESDTTLSAGIPPGESRLYKCRNGMWDVATPITVGGRHMGNVFIGQFFFEDETVDYDSFRAQARKFGFDEKEYLAALEVVPRLSRKVVEGTMSLFGMVSDTLSLLTYSNIELARAWSQGEALTLSLKKSEERLKTAGAIAHLGGWDLDLATGDLTWSEEFYRILGLDQESDGNYKTFLQAVHPDDRGTVHAAYSDSLRDGRNSYEIEHRIVRKQTGEVRFVRQKCEHFRDQAGRVMRSIGIIHDITELKSRESRITALSRLYEILSRVNEVIVRIGDEKTLFDEVCRIVSEVGGFPLVWIGRPDGDHVVALSSCGPAREYLEAVKAHAHTDLVASPLNAAINEGRLIVTDDFDVKPAASWPWRETAGRYGLRSSAFLPIRCAGKVFGAFGIYSEDAGFFNPEQAALLETLGADISYALETLDAETRRAGIEAELARAKDQWERTFDSVPDMIAILDRNHRIVRMNASMAKRIGVRQGECAGLPCFQAVHGSSEPPPFCPHSRTIKDCQQHVAEIYDERLGGNFEISTTPVYDDRGESIGSVHVIHDVTARTRHERDREQAVRFLSLINRSTTKKELIHETLAFFHKEMNCEAVAVRLREGEDYPCFEALGFPDRFCPEQTGLCAPGQGVGRLAGGDGDFVECMCRRVIEGRADASKTCFTPAGSFHTNSAAGFLAVLGERGTPEGWCIGQGYESILLVALRVGGQCLGLLHLGDRQTGVLSRDRVLTMERLSGYLAIALGKLNAEEELKNARDELERRVEERTIELRQAYDKLIEETKEREQVESQLRQAQKMDALGTLTGGVAHDFNNILAAILGFTDMVRGHLPEDSRDAKSLERVMEAGIRGRELIKQMLSFSRKGEVEKRPMHPGAIIRETMELLRASIPTTISIRVNVDSRSGKIMGDPIQLQQVLMNLCTNAAYAMRENGGILDIVLSDLVACEQAPGSAGREEYVRLTVRDTGEGIPAGDMDKIFDPFFTTKKRGEGTGLGLSVVHGIVHQLEGHIGVESQPGRGTVFHVDFPKIAESDRIEKANREALTTGNERILFVDDEKLLVQLAQEILEELGYRVVSYTGSRAALACFRLDPSQFDVVITDQTMPEMTGIDLAREVMAIRPDLPVVLCTGYSHQVNSEAAARAGIKAFVMKPLTKRELAKVLREVLDSGNQRS